jgi:hypothetical protein
MIRVARHFLARRSRATGRCRRAAWALAPALLLLPQGAHSDALDQYTVQVLAQSGVQTPGFNPIRNFFGIYQMNDHGQISLVTTTKESNSHQVLGVLSNGQFTPIAAGGGPSPDGKTWGQEAGGGKFWFGQTKPWRSGRGSHSKGEQR